MLQHFLEIIADGSQWAVRLRSLMAEKPKTELADMGFPPDWEIAQFWKFT